VLLFDPSALVDDALENALNDLGTRSRGGLLDQSLEHGALAFGIIHGESPLSLVFPDLEDELDSPQNEQKHLIIYRVNLGTEGGQVKLGGHGRR
jgi:hypothetical protein